MRLRPSGRQGPVATGLPAFKAYQRDEAWTWEHLALTRARYVAGNTDLGDEVEAFRLELLPDCGPATKILEDVSDMRRRLAEAKPGEGVWDVKSGPGGLMDIELAAQASALLAGSGARRVAAQLDAGVAHGALDAAQGAALTATYALLVKVNQVARLVTQRVVDVTALGQSAVDFLLRETGFDTLQALEAALGTARAQAAEIIDTRIGTGTGNKNG